MKHISLRPDSWNSERRRYLLTFLLGFGTLLLVFLPVIIADGGYFIYYGDFNSQQIPFYNLANDAVRSGSFGWNWYTDLGANFIGSYAFYLFGSPFFWITTILPRSWVTFSIPILLCIKHGVAALTAYAYICRFVQNSNAAIVGGLLYAFSGFQLFNLFFNHFQDVTQLPCSPPSTISSSRDKWYFWCSISLCAAFPGISMPPCESSSSCSLKQFSALPLRAPFCFRQPSPSLPTIGFPNTSMAWT